MGSAASLELGGVVEGKGFASGNGSVGGELVAVVDEHAGAEMKAAGKGKPVVVSFYGAEAELGRVGDSVLVEAAVVVEYVEPGAQVGTGGERWQLLPRPPGKDALMAMPSRENGWLDSDCAEPRVGSMKTASRRTNGAWRGMRILRFIYLSASRRTQINDELTAVQWALNSGAECRLHTALFNTFNNLTRPPGPSRRVPDLRAKLPRA
jgi:hypothetical protein